MGQATARRSGMGRPAAGGSRGAFGRPYRAQAMERIRLISDGVRAVEAKEWLEISHLGRNATLKALDLPVATFNRKVAADARLSPAESERVIGFARLVGQVEAMVAEGGGPADFDAQAWLATWLVTELPALGGERPIDLLGTMEGQGLVSQTLAQIGSGAYA